MKKSIYIWLAAAALAFNACSDDYLNTTRTTPTRRRSSSRQRT
nr:hypothetical protein [Hoylesella pleuritidis]